MGGAYHGPEQFSPEALVAGVFNSYLFLKWKLLYLDKTIKYLS